MMGWKIWVLGTTILLTERLIGIPAAGIVGSVLMWIGCILFLIDR